MTFSIELISLDLGLRLITKMGLDTTTIYVAAAPIYVAAAPPQTFRPLPGILGG